MRNQASEVYNYLDRPVTVSGERQTPQVLRTKFQNLKRYSINGNDYFGFNQVDEANEPRPDMGCSEKIVLYSEEELLSAVESNKEPNACALLKLPKHNKIKQVQSEAMALGLSSNAFGLTTASASMVCYEGNPALFVPFDSMRPLTEISAGRDVTKADGKLAYEGSTVDPLGNGLSPNIFLEDFGNAFGLMYLCGDPDAVGRKNQNKGFIGRNLYVFDQAVTNHEYPTVFDLFYIDSRLSLKPSTRILGRLRHTRGRNFSLIEDASIDAKFASLSAEKIDAALNYCNEVIAGLEARIEFTDRSQIPGHTALINSAKNTRNVLIGRIQRYRQILPRAIDIDPETVKNSLIFEKILNNPKLFTDIGRPYRNLTTPAPHMLKVNEITRVDADKVNIRFNNKLDDIAINRIQDALGIDTVQFSGSKRSLTIPESMLANLEKAFYPEVTFNLDDDTNYLDTQHIIHLCTTYNFRNLDLPLINRKYLQLTAESTTSTMDIIQVERRYIARKAAKSENIPFFKHYIKCFELDAQQKLQKFIKYQLTDTLDAEKAERLVSEQKQAFSTAIKLDCINEFNNLTDLYARNLDNPQTSSKIQAIFTKYANIDEQNMTFEGAAALRKEFTQEIKSCLSPNQAQNYRAELQDITGRKPESNQEDSDSNDIISPG